MANDLKQRVHGANTLYWSDKYAINENEIVDFSSNINIFSPDLDFEKIFKGSMDFFNQYPDIRYSKLRNAIARHYEVSSENVIPGNGATELIYLIMKMPFFKTIGIFNPTFCEYERAAIIAGKKVISLSYKILDEMNSGSFPKDRLPFEELDLVILCNPNNPTGEIKNPDRLIAYLQEKNIFIMVDETFIDFTDNTSHTAMRLLDKFPNLSVLKAITKYHALTGLRLGYLFTGNCILREKLWAFKEPWTVNCVAENVTLEMFSEKNLRMMEKFKNQTQNYYKKEINRLKELYKQMDFIKSISNTVTNFLCLEFHPPIKAEELQRRLIERYGLLIRSCADFDSLTDHFVRIAIKNQSDNDRLLQSIQGLSNLK